jgi:hypothetical protein
VTSWVVPSKHLTKHDQGAQSHSQGLSPTRTLVEHRPSEPLST